tara:strand:- start:388 stop:510 length:123 start_codon:yes stop_codon:yes gene_type:complete
MTTSTKYSTGLTHYGHYLNILPKGIANPTLGSVDEVTLSI